MLANVEGHVASHGSQTQAKGPRDGRNIRCSEHDTVEVDPIVINPVLHGWQEAQELQTAYSDSAELCWAFMIMCFKSPTVCPIIIADTLHPLCNTKNVNRFKTGKSSTCTTDSWSA